MTDLAERTEIVAEIRTLALSAGAAIMRVYETDFDVECKDDHRPVTAADRAADAIIVDGLEARFPHIPVVTEERAATHGAASEDRFFLVDPLDGTAEFVSRNGEFTVNIALIEEGEPVLGVVYAPAADRLFYTLADGTAAEEPEPGGNGAAAACRVVTVSVADNRALRVVASRSHRDPERRVSLDHRRESPGSGARLARAS